MDHIQVTRDGAVGIITIDRRERFNSLDVATAQDFRKAGLQLARDESARCVVIRGAGGVFCSGADLKYIRGQGDERDFGYLQPEGVGPAAGFGESFKQILEYIHSTISEIRRAPKPFIAAVDGVAGAGGFGIAMSCDLVLASTRASFEWAYSKTGLTGAESSTFLLPRLIGLRRSMELMLLNPRLGAAQALEYGLITAVHDVDRFDEAVAAVAGRLAAGPQRAFAIAKELLNQAAGFDQLDAHLDREIRELARVADGPEFAQALAAFFEKRAPVFAEDAPTASDTGLTTSDTGLTTSDTGLTTSCRSR
jgi:2-(1,2-epoxy-1,2-dihydrophenyl)acetyl-CoA isomerase